MISLEEALELTALCRRRWPAFPHGSLARLLGERSIQKTLQNRAALTPSILISGVTSDKATEELYLQVIQAL
jgi:hypothetical protein